MTRLTEERMTQALIYLAETDEQVAELKADVARAEYKVKLIRKRIFLVSTGTVAERDARAEVHPDTETAESSLADSIEAYEAMRAKRLTETLIIEVYRTVEASRRMGS